MSDLLRKVYRLGFEASGEGYNGEYPFAGVDLDKNDQWTSMRDDDLSDLTSALAIEQELIQRFGYSANGVLTPNANGLWVRYSDHITVIQNCIAIAKQVCLDDEDYGRASEIEAALSAISGEASK